MKTRLINNEQSNPKKTNLNRSSIALVGRRQTETEESRERERERERKRNRRKKRKKKSTSMSQGQHYLHWLLLFLSAFLPHLVSRGRDAYVLLRIDVFLMMLNIHAHAQTSLICPLLAVISDRPFLVWKFSFRIG